MILPLQHCADAREQLSDAERLEHIVIRTDREFDDTIDLRGSRGHDDDGHATGLRLRTKSPADLGARQVREQEVEQDEIGTGHHPLPKMWRPHAGPRGRLRPRRHRPHLARRPRSACASSSRPAPVAPLTARPFGDVFSLPRPAAGLAALSALAAHFVMRALLLAPWTVPKSSDRALRRSPPDRSALPLAPKFPLRTA